MRGIKRTTEGLSTACYYASLGVGMLEYQLERAKVNVRVALHEHRTRRAKQALESVMPELHLALMIYQQLKGV